MKCNIASEFDIRLLSHKKAMLLCQDILGRQLQASDDVDGNCAIRPDLSSLVDFLSSKIRLSEDLECVATFPSCGEVNDALLKLSVADSPGEEAESAEMMCPSVTRG